MTHPTVCPLCGAIIFFHTNGNGDCVFFDDLGPPWPKHACLCSEDGVRAASRSGELMRLVDRLAAPTHIAAPAGCPIHEFDGTEVGRLVVGVVLSNKQRKAWRSNPGTAVRQAVQVLAVTLQLGPKKLLRVYTPVGVHFRVGDVVQLAPREETLDGRSVLYAESGSTVVPPQEGHAVRIAILGWGSLLWEGGAEFDRWHGPWQYDGPALKLEFSRVSQRRLGALTLVIDEVHGTPTTVAWCLARRVNLEDAVGDLRSREDTTADNIGRLIVTPRAVSSTEHGAEDPKLAWARLKGLAAVVWTALQSNFQEKTQRPFSVDGAVSYLRTLEPEAKAKAVEYVRRAPEFVRTPVRSALLTEQWFLEAGS
jgi:hypothetical protein